MNSKLPDTIVIEGLSGTKRLSAADWQQMTEGQKVQAITRNYVTFYKNGNVIPIREALAALSYKQK